MPSKKKKYNARFPAGRIKKIMQTDEEIGKVAQAVPVIISRTLELFVESLLKRAMQITSAKNAKTLTPTHMKQCILSESRFDFLKDLVKGIPDVSSIDEEFGTPCGNLSPGTPISAKAYTCFQFHQSSDSGSSRSSSVASQPSSIQTSQPRFYKEIPIGNEDCENKICDNTTPFAFSGTTVIQHTGSNFSIHYTLPNNGKEQVPSLLRNISGQNITQLNELKLSNCIKLSENSRIASETNDLKDAEVNEETDEIAEDTTQEVKENGYHKTHVMCAIDEDYDT
ncbi:hypothetical protein RUM44_007407 [Polyplax serrata]|uniref:Transcription factor CBF/NF-Y/archaeal histone domain-containing protein n=1 Tax=Polyplax serrata TaxID=468196 RepID=A0ABR1B0K2_POLSC